MSLEILAPDLGEIPVFPVTKPDRYDWRDGVLIRTPNWLGDIVMTLPAMMQLRRAVPEKCGIFVACPKGLAPVFHALPDLVDKVVELRDAHRFPTRAEMSEIRALYAGIGILFNNSFRDASGADPPSLRSRRPQPFLASDPGFSIPETAGPRIEPPSPRCKISFDVHGAGRPCMGRFASGIQDSV